MIKNNLKTAIIVSDIPHTRRIQTLLNFIDVVNDKNLYFNIVGSDATWWDTNTYYKIKKAKAFAFREFIKTIYAYVAFGFLDKLGLYDETRELMMPYYKYIKKEIDTITYFYLKNSSK